MNMNELWWTTVPNSVRFTNDIVAAFNEGSSVIYSISEKCEWLDTMRSTIKDKILSGVDKTHEVSGKMIGNHLPGEFLAETFVKKELRASYRTSIGYETFLTNIEKETSLIHSFIYLIDLSDKQVNDWLIFITKYNKLHKPNSQKCKFIIEVKNDLPENHKGIKLFRRSDYLQNYDIAILCMMAMSSGKMNNIFREYATEIATLCSNNDPEFAAELIAKSDRLIVDTGAVIENTVSSAKRSSMEAFEEIEDVERKIWKAQLKVFFPLIERFRLYLIEKYKSAIPLYKYLTNMKGEEIKSIYDVELATLKWLCNNGEMYINGDDHNDLKFFKECRNDLAHLKTLSYDSLKRIVDTVDRI